MSIGAVIVAAGMSSRMGDFKPMLSIGSQSIARRIVSTLRQAGAEEIVMITGHNADALERHLEGCGLTVPSETSAMRQRRCSTRRHWGLII